MKKLFADVLAFCTLVISMGSCHAQPAYSPEDIRLREEIAQMLLSAGFKSVEIFGDRTFRHGHVLQSAERDDLTPALRKGLQVVVHVTQVRFVREKEELLLRHAAPRDRPHVLLEHEVPRRIEFQSDERPRFEATSPDDGVVETVDCEDAVCIDNM